MNEEVEKKDIRKTVVSSLSWVGLTTFFTQLVTFGVTIFVIRLLSPNDLGLRHTGENGLLFVTTR